jgi:hypothetical protein
VDDDRGETEPRHGRQPTWQQRVGGAGAGREPNGQTDKRLLVALLSRLGVSEFILLGLPFRSVFLFWNLRVKSPDLELEEAWCLVPFSEATVQKTDQSNQPPAPADGIAATDGDLFSISLTKTFF